MALCLYAVIRGIKDGFARFRDGLREGKSSSCVICFALLIMVFGYFSQALFSSSVTNIAVYKWILMGLVLSGAGRKESAAADVEKVSE